MTTQLLEDIRSQLLYEAAKPALSDKEIEDVKKIVSKAVGKKVDAPVGDAYMRTGAIDFGGHGRLEIFVNAGSNGRPPYTITVEDNEEGDVIDSKKANDYKSMVKVVTTFAKKHKKGLSSF